MRVLVTIEPDSIDRDHYRVTVDELRVGELRSTSTHLTIVSALTWIERELRWLYAEELRAAG